LLADNSTFFKNFWSIYLESGVYPFGYNDFYEPRTWGLVYKMPLSYYVALNSATNARKKFRLTETLIFSHYPGNNNINYSVELVPRFRFSDRFTVSLDMYYEKNLNSYGWAETATDAGNNTITYFGRRDLMTLSNILSARYTFSTATSLTFRMRHYWSTAHYLEYYRLNDQGHLDQDPISLDHDINYNAFTIDMQFVWYFAPGSEIDFVWKNDINAMDNVIAKNYWNDIHQTLNSPQSNSLSVRILYYIDYLSIKKNLFTRRKAEERESKS